MTRQSCDPVNDVINHHLTRGTLVQISTSCHVWNLRYREVYTPLPVRILQKRYALKGLSQEVIFAPGQLDLK